MSMKRTIHSAVGKAFDSLGDLVVEASLESTSVADYNFETGEYTPSTNLTVSVRAVRTGKVTTSQDSTKPPIEFIIQDPGIDLSLYTKLLVSGQEYLIDSFEQYEGASLLRMRSA